MRDACGLWEMIYEVLELGRVVYAIGMDRASGMAFSMGYRHFSYAWFIEISLA